MVTLASRVGSPVRCDSHRPGTTNSFTVIPREGGESSKPRKLEVLALSLTFAITGSPAFAGDDKDPVVHAEKKLVPLLLTSVT